MKTLTQFYVEIHISKYTLYILVSFLRETCVIVVGLDKLVELHHHQSLVPGVGYNLHEFFSSIWIYPKQNPRIGYASSHLSSLPAMPFLAYLFSLVGHQPT